MSAIVPFGYRHRSDNDNHFVPDPVNGPIVTELFTKRAAGEGWADLRRWLEGLDARTQRGRDVWPLRAMRDIIRNDVYLGIASHGEFRKDNAHEPLTDPATWRRAQRRGQQTRSRASEPAMLGGLLRCAGCRYIMSAHTRVLTNGQVVHDYRCRYGAAEGQRCTSIASASHFDGIEEFVVEQFFAHIDGMKPRRSPTTPARVNHRRARRRAYRPR